MSSDNTLISGVGLRDSHTSLTSNVSFSRDLLVPAAGILQPTETPLATAATATARYLRNADSGKLFKLRLSGAGALTLTVGPDVENGSYFDFVTLVVGGAGNVVIDAGTGRTLQGTINMNGGVVTQVTVTHTLFNILAAADSVGDRVRVTKISNTKVQVEAVGVQAAAFSTA